MLLMRENPRCNSKGGDGDGGQQVVSSEWCFVSFVVGGCVLTIMREVQVLGTGSDRHMNLLREEQTTLTNPG